MNNLQRTVFLAVLVPLAFGVLTIVETGGFILPFPLNEIIFAIAAYVFVLRLFRSEKLQSTFVFFFATLNLFSTEFIWSLFSTQETLQYHYENGVFDTIRFFSYLMLFGWLLTVCLRKWNYLKLGLGAVAIVLFLVGLLNEWYFLMVMATYLPFIAAFKFNEFKPYHLLWLLLSILNTMTLVMFQLAKA